MRRTLAIVLVAAVLAGCSGGSGSSGTSSSSGEGASSAVAATDDVVAEALGFTAPLIDGGELDVRSLGGRPVVFWFWSPHCPICNAEATSVEAASAEWAGRASFVGVAWAGDRDEFRGFVDRYELTFPQLDDAAGEVFDRFAVVTQPAVVVVGTDGELRRLTGRADGPSISAALAGLAWSLRSPVETVGRPTVTTCV